MNHMKVLQEEGGNLSFQLLMNVSPRRLFLAADEIGYKWFSPHKRTRQPHHIHLGIDTVRDRFSTLVSTENKDTQQSKCVR